MCYNQEIEQRERVSPDVDGHVPFLYAKKRESEVIVMTKIEKRGKTLTMTILSLSLLTVMAGAAVAPALDVIKTYFSGTNQTLVQMIISIPALFIALTNLFFPRLCKHFKTRTLVLAGLFLYTVGGCAAGLFSNIYLVLVFRAFVGIGVGIIMPMSTGLLSFYYDRSEQDKLMGYSSAMNQMGGVVATLISGMLATVSWRASFLVYLMGLISIILVLMFLPNDRLGGNDRKKETGVFAKNYMFIIAMFLLMFTFFVYPTAFAIETAKKGTIPMHLIAVIMASMDFVAFLGGLSFIHVKRKLGNGTKFAAPMLFCAGYLLLLFFDSVPLVVLGSWCIGFANGLGIPFLISAASQRAGKSAATTVMPMLSIAMYLAQFLTPMLLSGFSAPYRAAVIAAAIFILWSSAIKSDAAQA